nr:MAG TPA: hypothetical protein [Caudoviricetes sp.]
MQRRGRCWRNAGHGKQRNCSPSIALREQWARAYSFFLISMMSNSSAMMV